jgi:hypothetical protein
MSLLRVLSLLLLVHLATAQVINTKLDEDPVFRAVLSRRISYPVYAEQVGIYAKVYAGFRIDQRGHIQDVSILNPVKIGYGLEEEVMKRVKLLPPLNPKYEGSYALPVTFAFVDHTTNGVEAISPPGKLDHQYVQNRVLLTEIKVIGGRTPRQKGNMSTQSVGQVVTTDH